MKKILLCLILASSAAIASDVVTIYNYSGRDMKIWAEDGFDYNLPSGALVYFHVASQSAQMVATDYNGMYSYDLDFSQGPVATIGINWTSFTGEWSSIYGKTGEIGSGFSLGLAVWAICGGSAWLVGIGKQLVNAAS